MKYCCYSLFLIFLRASGWDFTQVLDDRPILNYANNGYPYTRERELAPIRLGFYYYDFNLGTREENKYFTEVVMDSVNELLSSVLLVYSLQGPLALKGLDSCGDEVPIPLEHRRFGVPDTDLMIYITTTIQESESWVAYAGACLLEPSGRHNVLAGRLVLNVPYFTTYGFEQQLSLVTHEITHILGFSDGMYSLFTDENGDEYGLLGVVAEIELRGTTRSVIKTPTVLKEARSIFGCETLQGLELENGGGDGSAGSHWESRVVGLDYMAATTTKDAMYSRFTFALLKDTGWYDINWDYTQIPAFGYHKGCEFHKRDCVDKGVAQWDEFCDDMKDTCDFYHLYKGYCDLVKFPMPVPEEYQYWINPKLGGVSEYRDYCPVKNMYSDGSCRGTSGIPTTLIAEYGEIVCPNCRCLEGTLVQAGGHGKGTLLHTGCYEVVQCHKDRVDLRVGNGHTGFFIVSCPFEGGQVNVPGYLGTLNCPESDVLCSERVPCLNACYGKGRCVDGKCLCNEGSVGIDCSIKCHETCGHCNGPRPEDCLSCHSELAELTDEGECECEGNFEMVAGECECFGVVDDDEDCVFPCELLCEECNEGTGECDECVSHASEVGGVCVCNEGYSSIGEECVEDVVS